MMKRYFFCICLLIVTQLSMASNTLAIEGLRGQTWGELRWEFPKEGGETLYSQGWIRQGVDWAKWGNTTLNTYATLRYRWEDSGDIDWANSIGPGAGIALDLYSHKGIAISWGAEYIWDRFYRSGRTDQKAVIYMGWYGWWDLMKRP